MVMVVGIKYIINMYAVRLEQGTWLSGAFTNPRPTGMPLAGDKYKEIYSFGVPCQLSVSGICIKFLAHDIAPKYVF